MSRALVTGVTGMLGAYIASRIAEEGWAVRGLVRNPLDRASIDAEGLEPVSGDLLDAPSLERAARGCDAIFHAAAAIGAGGSLRDFERTNVVGTQNVIAAAGRAAARLVHVSSTAVFGAGRYRDQPADEDQDLPELDAADFYGRSKQAAERAVLSAHAEGRIRASVVRPPVMYGRGDRQFLPRVAPVLMRGWFPLFGGGETTLPLVHADAVADGAVRAALSRTAEGRVYHLTCDYPLTVSELVRLGSAGLGRRIRAPSVPAAVGELAFSMLATGLRWTGRPDLARHAPGTFQMLVRDNPFSSQRARDEIGWAPRIPPSIGVPDAFRCWREGSQQKAGGRG